MLKRNAGLMRRILLLLTAIFVVVGCNEIPPPPPPPTETSVGPPAGPVTTDRARYGMDEGPYGPQVVITSTLTAPPSQQLYLANCNGAFSTSLQKREAGGWVYVWSQAMNACMSAPIIIGAGQRLSTTTTALSGAHSAVSSAANNTVIDGGTYRIVWNGLYASFDMSDLRASSELPLEARVSAPFVIDPPSPPDLTKTSPRERPDIIRAIQPEHAATISGRAPISVTFIRPTETILGDPQLYVDREWIENPQRIVTESLPPASLTLQYEPRKPWSPGMHRVRVIYQDALKETRWYAWSFIAQQDLEGDP